MKKVLKGIYLLLIVGLLGGCCPMPYQPPYIMADKASKEKETVSAESTLPSKALSHPSPNHP